MNKNSVTLVGAGCSKELLTLRGLEEIKKADVIIYDDLIDKDILLYRKKSCELVYVGKRLGKHSESQRTINELIINNTKEDKYVVRLKGGDSFVFGRGGEEVLALQSADIPYEVIPGVSSCIAVAEKMGIPVTHRGVSQSFTVVTGRTATEKDENYKALAELKGTIIFLMGLSKLREIAEKLIENGKSKDTLCSVLSCGYGEEERRFDGTLETIFEKAKSAKTPSIIVVGDVCGFDFSKTKLSSLSGASVTVTGTRRFTAKLSEKLGCLGASVTACPYLEIEEITDNIPKDLNDFKWLVFTSSNGVETFFEYAKREKMDFRSFCAKKFACIGKGSAQKLSSYGFNADLVPDEYTALSLGEKLVSAVKDEKILILRAQNGSPLLTEKLEENGKRFEDAHIYKTVADRKTAENISCESDYIVFASGSGVSVFFENAGRLGKAKPVCIGEFTADVLKNYTDRDFLISEKHTADDIIKIIINDLGRL